MKIQCWLVCVTLALVPRVVHADTFFVANLDGVQVVPVNPPTPATGFGRITLNDAETAIVVSIYYFGLLTNVTAVHLHGPAAPGFNGGIIATIPTAGATTGQGVNVPFSITPTAVIDLKAGLYYFDIHTANSPNGESRPVARRPGVDRHAVRPQEVPASGSAGTGRGFASLNAAEALALVSVRWSGLGTNTILAHSHRPPGRERRQSLRPESADRGDERRRCRRAVPARSGAGRANSNREVCISTFTRCRFRTARFAGRSSGRLSLRFRRRLAHRSGPRQKHGHARGLVGSSLGRRRPVLHLGHALGLLV